MINDKNLGLTKDLLEAVKKVIDPLNEGLRLVSTHSEGNKTAKVYKDNDWGEYRVKHYTDGKHHTEADHHTDDKDDAIGTAQHWIKPKLKEEIEPKKVEISGKKTKVILDPKTKDKLTDPKITNEEKAILDEIAAEFEESYNIGDFVTRYGKIAHMSGSSKDVMKYRRHLKKIAIQHHKSEDEMHQFIKLQASRAGLHH